MATKEEVRKLAALARLTIADDELETFIGEFDAILVYIGQLEKLEFAPAGGGSASGGKPPLRNVMREDGEPHAPCAYTERLAEQFPAREGDALLVKQIISHD